MTASPFSNLTAVLEHVMFAAPLPVELADHPIVRAYQHQTMHPDLAFDLCAPVYGALARINGQTTSLRVPDDPASSMPPTWGDNRQYDPADPANLPDYAASLYHAYAAAHASLSEPMGHAHHNPPVSGPTIYFVLRSSFASPLAYHTYCATGLIHYYTHIMPRLADNLGYRPDRPNRTHPIGHADTQNEYLARLMPSLLVLGMALHQALPVPYDLLHPTTLTGDVTRESWDTQYHSAFAMEVYQAFFNTVQMQASKHGAAQITPSQLFADPYHPIKQVLEDPAFPETDPRMHPHLHQPPSAPDDVVWFTPHRASLSFIAASAARNGYAMRFPTKPTPVTPESEAAARSALASLTGGDPDNNPDNTSEDTSYHG